VPLVAQEKAQETLIDSQRSTIDHSRRPIHMLWAAARDHTTNIPIFSRHHPRVYRLSTQFSVETAMMTVSSRTTRNARLSSARDGFRAVASGKIIEISAPHRNGPEADL
jgi:hypothetical protein